MHIPGHKSSSFRLSQPQPQMRRQSIRYTMFEAAHIVSRRRHAQRGHPHSQSFADGRECTGRNGYGWLQPDVACQVLQVLSAMVLQATARIRSKKPKARNSRESQPRLVSKPALKSLTYLRLGSEMMQKALQLAAVEELIPYPFHAVPQHQRRTSSSSRPLPSSCKPKGLPHLSH